MPRYKYECDNCKKIYFELRQESDPQWILACDVCAGSFLEVEDTDPLRVEPEKPLEGMAPEIIVSEIIDAVIVQGEIEAPIEEPTV